MDKVSQSQRSSGNQNQTDGHIVVVPWPLQGHAAPLVKLSHQLTKFGAKVTFLTTDAVRKGITAEMNHGIEIMSINDGLEVEGGWKDQYEMGHNFYRVIPGYLENLLKQTNQSTNSNDRISGVILDSPLSWLLEVPKRMGIKAAVYWCSSTGCLALGLKIPQLIDSKFFDNDGTPLENDKLELLPNMPAMTPTDLTWTCPGDANKQASMFHFAKGLIPHMSNADWILCNWFHELDPAACNLTPNILSIGPLLANGQSAGSFCSEDSTCLTWLDKQPKRSVVYVAFGSTSTFSQQQLDELASGLELMGRPFLWVAWSGLKDGSSPAYTKEFAERVADHGKMVEWAPQEAVLGHPSTACFITHCGWGSFMESLSVGVPLLCWPYFGDQLYTRTCICDAWKVGKELKPDESGLISRYEIKQKVDEVLSDGMIRENALKLKEMARKSISNGGSSLVNIEYLVQQMKC